MRRPLSTLLSVTMCACAGILILVTLDGCQSTQTSSGTQEVAKPLPPPPPPPPAPEPPPPPPAAPQQEMVAQAAAAPTEDPLAWATGLEDVLFDYDKSAIRKSEQGKLAAAAKALKADKARKVLIEGHCDERGTSALQSGPGRSPGQGREKIPRGSRRDGLATADDQLWQGAAALY